MPIKVPQNKPQNKKVPVKKKKRKDPAKKGFYLSLLALFLVAILSGYFYNLEENRKLKIKEEERSTASHPEKTTDASAPPPGEKQEADKPLNNRPVILKTKLRLESANNKDVFKVIAEGYDKDGDAVTFKYEWTKNNEPAGSGDNLNGFKRGDKISVKITPFDGKDYGAPRILTTEIKNSTPKIIEHKEVKLEGDLLTYQVKASDPDGDELSYSLVSGPKGMTIDSFTGLIKWPVKQKDSGKYEVKVKASDNHGGETDYDFTITLPSLEGS
jgi:hypothetical protein